MNQTVSYNFEHLMRELNLDIIEEEKSRNMSNDQRITVLLDLPHLNMYDLVSQKELTYKCDFPVAVGDLVVCPPTPMKKSTTVGVVTSLTDGGYTGPVKKVSRFNQ